MNLNFWPITEPSCNSVFPFRRVTDNELVKVLLSLKPSKASGLDNITNTLLKAAIYTINETLLYYDDNNH